MEKHNNLDAIRHRSRFEQIPMYLKKLFRMFIFMNDWKVIPMSALVAAVTAMVVANKMYVDMEGTVQGSLALSCICIWNGFFNSIQSICRERDVIKREHRNGMYVSSYVIAHMIYQAFICIIQTVITLSICKMWGMAFPTDKMPEAEYMFYIGVTLFLVTYSADMMALLISGIARTTTSAMTVMPFMLIFELVFSNSVFKLSGTFSWITDLSVAKWGIRCLAAQANYNSLPLSAPWNQISAWADTEVMGIKPGELILNNMDKHDFCMLMATKNQNLDYITNPKNIMTCWLALGVFTLIFAVFTIVALKRIDSDKR